jgi:hypothetical protein
VISADADATPITDTEAMAATIPARTVNLRRDIS